MFACQNARGAWTLFFTLDGVVYAYDRQDFGTENAALLFAAMNTRLLSAS